MKNLTTFVLIIFVCSPVLCIIAEPISDSEQAVRDAKIDVNLNISENFIYGASIGFTSCLLNYGTLLYEEDRRYSQFNTSAYAGYVHRGYLAMFGYVARYS